MIYVSISTIPQRLKNLNETVESLLKQTQKPNKIFINIPYKYERFSETIEDNQIPKFNSDIVEIEKPLTSFEIELQLQERKQNAK